MPLIMSRARCNRISIKMRSKNNNSLLRSVLRRSWSVALCCDLLINILIYSLRMSDDAKDVLKRNAFSLLDYITDKAFTNVLLAKNIQEFFLLLVNKREDILVQLDVVDNYINALDTMKEGLQSTITTVRIDLGKLAGINYCNEGAQDE